MEFTLTHTWRNAIIQTLSRGATIISSMPDGADCRRGYVKGRVAEVGPVVRPVLLGLWLRAAGLSPARESGGVLLRVNPTFEMYGMGFISG